MILALMMLNGLLGASVRPSLVRKRPSPPSRYYIQLQIDEKERVLSAIDALPIYHIPQAHSESALIQYKFKKSSNKRKGDRISSTANATVAKPPSKPLSRKPKAKHKPILKTTQLISIAKTYISPHFPLYSLNVTKRYGVN